jgi:hypothetical protein
MKAMNSAMAKIKNIYISESILLDRVECFLPVKIFIWL